MKTYQKVISKTKIFFVVAALIFLQEGVGIAKNSSNQSSSDGAGWEKIRDAQVQIIRKKQADLDKLKEEILKNKQVQMQPSATVAGIETQLKKHKAEWSAERLKYENQVTFLKEKVEDQRREINGLRKKLDNFLKNQSQSAALRK